MLRYAFLAGLLLGFGAAPAGAQSGGQGAAGAAEDPVVATVNGDAIHRSDVAAAYALLPEQYRSMPIQMLFDPLVERLINVKLAAAAGRAQNLHETAAVRDELRRAEDRILERAYFDGKITERVTDEAVRQRHAESVKDFKSEEEIRARHILLKTKEDAEKVIAELDGGADFAELASTRSEGPSKTQGGDLGYFSRARMVPEFSEAAFALDAGSYSKEPVQTQFGWHVIKVEDRRTTQPPSFEDREQELRGEMSRELVTELVEALKKDATIERFQPDGSPRPSDAGGSEEKKE